MSVSCINNVNTITNYNDIIHKNIEKQDFYNNVNVSKMDSVELNSSTSENDIMTIYEMLCNEFPEFGADYILTDRSNNKVFFNDIYSKIGSSGPNFGELNQKSVFIDVEVIKKIQENPAYYVKAKSALKVVLDSYDGWAADGAKRGRPYVTGCVTFEDGRMTASWSQMEGSFTNLVKSEESRIKEELEENIFNADYVKQKMDSLLDEFMESVTENMVNAEE